MSREIEQPQQQKQPPEANGGQRNCILEICCPPRSEGAVDALAEEMAGAFPTWPGTSPAAIAAWVLKNFDLAPKGSLQAFKDSIRDYAREGYEKAHPPQTPQRRGEGLL